MSFDNFQELQDFFDAVHRDFPAYRLDECARRVGYPSGIGRLSYITDDLLDELVRTLRVVDESRVLDLGCGNGFFGRWLRHHGIRSSYTGVDCSTAAIESARRLVPDGTFVIADLTTYRSNTTMDVVCTIEAIKGGVVTPEVARALLSPLGAGGRAFATMVDLDGRLSLKASESLASVHALGATALYTDVTERVRASAAAFAQALSEEHTVSNSVIHEDARGEAARVSKAIEEGHFGYGVIVVSNV